MRGEPHPNPEALASYLRCEGDWVAKHVESCSDCAVVLQRLKAFDDDYEQGPEWPEVSKRLERNFDAFLNSMPQRSADRAWRSSPNAEHNSIQRDESSGTVGPRGRSNDAGRQRTTFFLWHPIFAYLLAVALIYPAFLGLSNRRAVRPTRRSFESVRIIELDATRAAQRGPASTRKEGILVLEFFVPIRNGFHYSAQILAANGRDRSEPLKIQSYDGIGHFAITSATTVKGSESLILRVTEADQNGPSGRKFDFPFQP